MRRKKKFGLAFRDEVVKVTHPLGHFRGKKKGNISWDDAFVPNYQPEYEDLQVSLWRLVALGSIFLVIFFGLFLRLFHLQITQGEENRQLADSNRIQIRVIHAPRGVIYDRNGQVLAENNPGFRLNGEFISRDEALQLEAQNNPQYDDLEVDAIRSYPLAEVTSHVVGYVGEISPEELKDPQYGGNDIEKYKIGDRLGRAGIEQMYESVLRGVDGAEIIEIDAQGRKLRTIRQIDPIPGKNVYLSLDASLQKVAYQALKSTVEKEKVCCGTIIAENPQNGEILAMVSYPSFDANAFTDPKKNSLVENYFNDNNSPLLNRAIAGVYPPGSTFKITSALAGLSSGKIDQHTLIEDTGVMKLGPYQFANWYFTDYGKTEGLVDVVKALQRSNDIYFYKVGELVGEQTLGTMAKKMGMGKKLGIDLPDEADGLVPDDNWKQNNTGQPWYPGDTLHFAIGQGFLLTTPLQILAQTSVIASNGNLIQPHLATKITTPDGGLVKDFHSEPIEKNMFKQTDLDLVKKGLSLVPVEGGTAWPMYGFSIPNAGKTGTAEYGDPKDRTHAWYTAYAPLDNPQIAVTALVEAGGQGSNVAAPLIRQLFTSFFHIPDKADPSSPQATGSANILYKSLGE
ncbi:MAG: penicillin-binding protein 2 [Patescibacteria group bacterium]|nr:penicillin-binding protein 2 [Patescibacteria group bacterium]